MRVCRGAVGCSVNLAGQDMLRQEADIGTALKVKEVSLEEGVTGPGESQHRGRGQG